MEYSDIFRCNTIVNEAIEVLWPDSTSRASFFPLVNQEYGDIGSDVVIALSAERKEPPEVLGDRLLMHILDKDPSMPFSVSHGYINFRSSSDYLAYEEKPPLTFLSPIFIIFPGRTKEVSTESSFRVMCAALLQTKLLLDAGCKVVFCNAGGKHDVTHENIHSLAQEECVRIAEKSCLSVSDILEIQDEVRETLSYLWLAPGTYPRKQFNAVIQHRSRVEGKVVLKTPHANWCHGINPPITEKYISEVSSSWALIERALYYFSAPDAAFDIDPGVVFLNETANTRWFVDMLLSRLEGAAQEALYDPERLALVEPFANRLFNRNRYIRYHRHLAASQGLVSEYIWVLRDLLQMANRFYNDPALRARISASQMTLTDRQILSGVYRALQLVYKG